MATVPGSQHGGDHGPPRHPYPIPFVCLPALAACGHDAGPVQGAAGLAGVTRCRRYQLACATPAVAHAARVPIRGGSWSSQVARGYLTGVQSISGIAAMAARTLGSMVTVTENRPPPRRAAPQ